MELLNSFYELTESIVYIFGWLYENFFTRTIGETMSYAYSWLPDVVKDFLLSIYDVVGIDDWSWAAFLFGSGLVFIIVYKFITWLLDVWP